MQIKIITYVKSAKTFYGIVKPVKNVEKTFATNVYNGGLILNQIVQFAEILLKLKILMQLLLII